MKSVLIIPILLFLFLIACQQEDEIPQLPNVELIGTWDLMRLSGGFAGIDCTYESATVNFNFNQLQLVITNDFVPGNPCSGLPSGDYSYSVIEKDGRSFLILDDWEFGEIEIVANQMIINQNKLSNGAGDDGLIFSLQRS